jgi:hypothetical protein
MSRQYFRFLIKLQHAPIVKKEMQQTGSVWRNKAAQTLAFMVSNKLEWIKSFEFANKTSIESKDAIVIMSMMGPWFSPENKCEMSATNKIYVNILPHEDIKWAHQVQAQTASMVQHDRSNLLDENYQIATRPERWWLTKWMKSSSRIRILEISWISQSKWFKIHFESSIQN